MQQGMEQLQNSSDQALAKILDRGQMRRLREIKLQSDGPFVVLQPDMAMKLEINDEQIAELRQAQATSGAQRRQVMSQMRDVFQSLRNGQPGQTAANGQAAADANANTSAIPAGNGNGGRGRQGARGANTAQVGNGGPGGRGGPGGNRRGRFDPEAMRKLMEQPEVQAKMDQIRQQEDALTDQAYAMVFKTLDRRQGGTFRKMLGEKFDVSLLRRRPGGPARPATTEAANGDTPATANAEAPTAKTTTTSNAAAKSASTSATATSAAPKTKSATTKSPVRRRGSR